MQTKILKIASGVVDLLIVLQALDYSLQATPTILAVCSLSDQETNVGLLNFGDCDRQLGDGSTQPTCFCFAIVFCFSINCAETLLSLPIGNDM